MSIQNATTTSSATSSPDRVRSHTPAEINELIDLATQESTIYYAKQPNAVISARIQDLENEWDIERLLELTASSLGLSSLLLSRKNRTWLLLTGMVTTFLLQHALQGWCPPMALFRKLGVRTRREIDNEKFALKALRGDFDSLPSDGEDVARVHSTMNAIRA